MGDAEAAEDALIRALYGYTAEELENGKSAAEVEALLVEQGLARAPAAAVVSDIATARSKAEGEARQRAGRRHMGLGVLWLAGGLLVSGGTYTMAGAGGFHLLAYGAMLAGTVEFAYGVYRAVRGSVLVSRSTGPG